MGREWKVDEEEYWNVNYNMEVLRGHAQSGGRKKGWSLEIFYSKVITHFSKNLFSF